MRSVNNNVLLLYVIMSSFFLVRCNEYNENDYNLITQTVNTLILDSNKELEVFEDENNLESDFTKSNQHDTIFIRASFIPYGVSPFESKLYIGNRLGYIPSVYKDLVVELEKKNKQSKKLDVEILNTYSSTIFLDSRKCLEISYRDIVDFGLINYNSNFTKACFFFNHDCGKLCGHGEIACAKLVGSKWILDFRLPLWQE